MTNKEAIEYNKNLRMYMKLSDRNQSCKFLEENYIALDMAIKALEQQPCEDWHDVPSDEMTLEQARQAVKDLRKKLADHLEQEPCEDTISRQVAIDALSHMMDTDGFRDGWAVSRANVDCMLRSLPSAQLEKCTEERTKTHACDCISRQAVLDTIDSYMSHHMGLLDLKLFVTELPSVQPQPKIGHWEWVQYDSNPNIGNWHCSECKAIVLHMPEWCPMCGAKMSENPTGLESEEA